MRKYIKWILIGIPALLVIVAVYPFIFSDMETLELNDAVRAAMPNESFVKLSDGYTHYEWAGPENGQPVILVCGAGTPMFMWDYEFRALVDAGFHVLRYDHFSRGLSDRVEYTPDLYDRQLLELLDSQNISTPVDMVGKSMGGALTIRFVDRYPERVRRFALMAPAGFRSHTPLMVKILCWPFVGEWVLMAAGDRMISTAVPNFKDPEKKQEFLQNLQKQMKYKGTISSLLATLRDKSFFEMKPDYERVGKSGKHGILFWGTEDTDISFDQHFLVQAAIPSIEFHAIEGANHQDLPPEKMTPLLIEFLKK